jgi:iron-sulfur cluster repair protein YtfE (RIC family)
MKITEHTTVQDALKKSKHALNVFKKHNLYCPHCKGGGEDSIATVARNNGLDLKALLDELNETG